MPEIKRKSIDISMDKIDYNPENTNIFNMDEIESLAKRIEEEGFTSAILVYQKDDGRYEILSGHRRYEAMKQLKAKTIPADVLSGIATDTQRDLILLSSNMANRKLAPLDMARAIEFYKGILDRDPDFKGNKKIATADYFGITPSNVQRYSVILKLIPELQEYCKKPNFPYSSLSKAASLTKEEQKELLNKLIRLEADEKNISEEEVDKDEILFSRTRVEQIINGMVKTKENAQKKERNDSAVVFPMNAPVDEVSEAQENFDDLITRDDSMIEEPTFDFDNLISNAEEYSTINLAGFDQARVMIESYRNMAKSNADKKAIKEKIIELKQVLKELENSI